VKRAAVAILLLAAAAITHAADKYAPADGTLADALQWLTVQTACVGQYNMVHENPRQIVLYDPVARGQHTTMFNGV
jgi:hypothetical protein